MKIPPKISLSLGLILAAGIFLAVPSYAAEITGTRKATVKWNGIKEAESYNIYYKEAKETSFVHAVRDLSKDSRSLTINYLKNKGSYVYRLCAVDNKKVEFSCTGIRNLVGTTIANSSVIVTEKTIVQAPVVTGSRQATVSWEGNEKAEHFYILYRKSNESVWTHSVFNLDHNSRSFTIKYLDNVDYEYQIVALDGDYKPIGYSQIFRIKGH